MNHVQELSAPPRPPGEGGTALPAYATYLGDEDGVDFGVVLEVLEDLHSFSLGCGPIDIRSREEQGVLETSQNHTWGLETTFATKH